MSPDTAPETSANSQSVGLKNSPVCLHTNTCRNSSTPPTGSSNFWGSGLLRVVPPSRYRSRQRPLRSTKVARGQRTEFELVLSAARKAAPVLKSPRIEAVLAHYEATCNERSASDAAQAAAASAAAVSSGAGVDRAGRGGDARNDSTRTCACRGLSAISMAPCGGMRLAIH